MALSCAVLKWRGTQGHSSHPFELPVLGAGSSSLIPAVSAASSLVTS